MRLAPPLTGPRPIRRLAGAALMALIAGSPSVVLAADPGQVVLTAIEIAPDGRLARVTFRASAPIESFALSRQGPPEKRDLVVRFKGAASALSVPPTDVSGTDLLLPWKVSIEQEDGAPVVKILFEREGDSLVRVDHDAGRLSMILIPPESKRAQVADAYRIGSDDVLAISVFGHDDLTKTTKVSPDGLINFPLIGNVHASGRSVDDVSAEIQDRLAKDFLVDPHVTVSVWEYLSQWVNVIGEVAKPGRYYLTGPTTLVDAISQAGGLRPSAGESIVVTRRPSESNPAEAGEMMRFSATALFGDEKSSTNVRLRPGDVINVLAHEVVYVSGEVRSPGVYPLDRSTTLMKAITLAGGFTPAASGSILEIIREEGGQQTRTTVDVKEIEDRKVPDVVLKPGDVIVAKRRS